MSYIDLSDHQFTPNGYWNQPLESSKPPTARELALFDQNGYDLTDLEQRYAEVNCVLAKAHREHRRALKSPWFTQPERVEGAVLNHSLLFERKGYSGEALEQLEQWAQANPLVYKIIRMRPKWGLDFSMDYVDRAGNVFEVLHWEYDGFDFEEVETRKQQLEPKLAAIDWDDAAASILKLKDQWHHLDFFAQSDWKCNYFGIVKERFKMVIWE
ncbi:hypothetical protein [Nitrosomonas ureae]|uniref:Uncharacterized protein n=1 Tax=Nitrosomonas ureae TaxID=44577 RepID=A0A1H2FBV5_9PROT|nr:hypothetical protein [Nitrosomonas ureae]ALQ51306.1 hypothetical protein ATY38_08780 [Nitrosomonas ureae]SDU04824.1 hypothetical protein SAMN05216406_1203 [Nitrosomonas ureae]